MFVSQYPSFSIPEVDLGSLLFPQAGSPFANLRPRSSQKIALIDSVTGETTTFKELEERVSWLAKGLHDRGLLREHEVMAIYSPNHVEYAVALFAALRLGACTTPVNPTYTADELRFQLEDSSAVVLVTTPELVGTARKAITGTQVKEIFVFGNIGAPGAAPLRSLFSPGSPPHVEIKDPKIRNAFLCYSSGTTGRPKGVELSHYNIVATLLQIYHAERGLLNENEVYIAVLPLYHVLALVLILVQGIFLGFSVVIQPKFELEKFLAAIEKYRVTIANTVPPIALALANSELVSKYNLTSLHSLSCGAAPLGKDLQDRLATKLNCVVKQGYGMTELSPISHRTPNDPSQVVSGSVGILLPNNEAKLVDPTTGKEVGVGEEGELWIRGPNVMKGYLNRPDATAETIDKDGFLHTGDIAKVDKNGHFYITDRLKELIKVKGLQVAPAELEALLLVHPAIADVAVIGIPDERAGEAPKAFVVLKPGHKATKETGEEIVKYLDSKLAPHKRLRGGVQFIDAIPKSASGKILRRVLKDLEKQQQSKAPASKL